MLFIGRTMNKETQLGRKEKGRERKIGQSTESRILLAESHGHQRIDSLEVRAAESLFPLAARSPPHPVLQKRRSAP